MKIDLHIHSIYSDGSDDIQTIINKAGECDLIAITDHNTLEGDYELVKINNPKVLAGVEMSTDYKGKEIHLLAYFPSNTDFKDPSFDAFRSFVDLYKTSKYIQMEKIIQNLSYDYPVNYQEFLDYLQEIHNEGSFNRVHLAKYLVNKGIVQSINEAFDTLINSHSPYFVKQEKANFYEGIKLVTKLGGLISVAHMIQYHMSIEELKEMLEGIVPITNTFGIELFHYDHDEKTRNDYMEMVNELTKQYPCTIIYTAGSDCHGVHKVNEIGQPYHESLSTMHQLLYEQISQDFIHYWKTR